MNAVSESESLRQGHGSVTCINKPALFKFKGGKKFQTLSSSSFFESSDPCLDESADEEFSEGDEEEHDEADCDFEFSAELVH